MAGIPGDVAVTHTDSPWRMTAAPARSMGAVAFLLAGRTVHRLRLGRHAEGDPVDGGASSAVGPLRGLRAERLYQTRAVRCLMSVARRGVSFSWFPLLALAAVG